MDAIGILIEKLKNCPTLTEAQLHYLCRIAQHKEHRPSQEKIFRAHLRLVFHIARKVYRPTGTLDLGDLVQEGSLGLLRAIARYKPRPQGCRFSHYAYPWIYYAMKKAVRKEKRRARHREGSQMSPRVPPALRKRPEQWVEMADDPEALFCRNEAIAQAPLIRRLIIRLPKRERSLIKNRYGLPGGKLVQTLRQCGRRYRLTGAEAWRVEQHALSLLRLYAKDRQEELLPCE